ncbi:hypothetical protein FISHEDRAFT_63932 [Fistulina hepatica ATCC 64428]|uniref:Spindle pole body component n=1 Tax=Fistulina hepatica ATCC 64428 TaxID=1128425 RepID=A0A0D7AN42_9AGAR|nr:hypothetical protein FISHEDRAFT_63932 [Fistulina hepatica ATCC 64428]
MDPYTPRARSGLHRSKMTLTAQQYNKITDTIASVRKERRQYEEEHGHIHISRQTNGKGAHATHTGHEEPSFVEETSFVRAPLNSRVTSSSAVPRAKPGSKTLERVPVEVQEAIILEDLLYVLMGIEGTNITYHPEYSPEDDDPLQGIRFVIVSSLDSSLRDLVERILPLGTYYTAITSFIEQRSLLDYGLVNHALCASIRDMMKDYQTLLSQLEHAFNTSPQFSLQKLWFYVHPTLHTLSLIYQLVLELAAAGDPAPDYESSSLSIDSEQATRDEELGIGGAKLKAVIAESVGTDETILVKGGEVLTMIYERMQGMSGDPIATLVYSTLLRDASKPYITMLELWIRTGRLADPYNELLVKESKFIDRGILDVDYTDEYWERRYTVRLKASLSAQNNIQVYLNSQLRDGSAMSGGKGRVPAPRSVGGRLPGGACVPPLLEPWKHKILLAGKYLNVIRECGIEISRKDYQLDVDALSMDDDRFYAFLEEAYTHANKTLLQLLIRDQDLLPRLRSLKRYFFLSQSSWLPHLLDLAHTELRKSFKSASIVKLQSLLDLVLNTDAQGEDVMYRDDVRVTMAQSGLYDWLRKVVETRGLIGGADADNDIDERGKRDKEEKKEKTSLTAMDAFALDYSVKFPLSLVISRKTILRYQLLFRFILHLKQVEQALSAMWSEQKTGPWRRPAPENQDFERWRRRVFLLRTRMLSFVQQTLAYVTFEVFEPNWRRLETKLDKVVTVDELLRDHVDFLDTCLKECMLTSKQLLKTFSKLINTCSMFAAYSHRLATFANSAIEDEQSDELIRFKVGSFKETYRLSTDAIGQLHLDCVQFYASSENVALLPLVVRLNSVRTATGP